MSLNLTLGDKENKMNNYLVWLPVFIIVACGSFLIGVRVENYRWRKCCKRWLSGSLSSYFIMITRSNQVFKTITSTFIAVVILIVIWYVVAFCCNGFNDFLFNHNWIIVS